MTSPARAAAKPPSEALLTHLRGLVEHTGVPFEVARAALGVSEQDHSEWLRRAAVIFARQPDLTVRPDGALRVAGSDAPEAEYGRIQRTADAASAARYIAVLDKIAQDDRRGAAQVAALKLQLGALAPRLFGTHRVEAQLQAEVSAVRPADQEAIDRLPPAERAVVVDAARQMSALRDRYRAALAAAREADAADAPESGDEP